MSSNPMKAPASSSKGNGLLTASAKMRESLRVLKEINSKANIIALNAAIEGARTRGRLDSFSIVAEQIAGQANRNGELSEQLDKLVEKLQNVALRSTSARYFELAEDLIDKLDRNLFERNCDVQAWVTFDAIVACSEKARDWTPEEARANVEDPLVVNACRILERLMGTYVVYEDVVLCNRQGVAIATGRRRELIGTRQDKTEWFQSALAGKVHVADMKYAEELGKFVVCYSAPVATSDSSGLCGVLSTRFNWDYAQEMIDSAGYGSDMQAYVINREGVVLGSLDKTGIYRDTMEWLDGGRFTMKGQCGYSVETARNGVPIAVGFARTKGYNAYRGKEWSALVLARLGNIKYEHLWHVSVDRSGVAEGKVKIEDEDKLIESELANSELQTTMNQINELVSLINTTNNETNMLAINAAIQAGIAGTEGESFAVIAAEIGRLAEKSVAFVESVNKTARELQAAVESTVAARLSDAARDTIDKVDRNLFERFCDVQSWTAFEDIVAATTNGDPTGAVSEFLARLHKIYEVYHDIYLLDASGKIVSTGIRRDLRGQNQSNRQWFQEAMQGKVHVTEVYNSASANGLTMAFSAPVIGPDGKVTGVLTTRFNWDFIYGILDAVIVDSRSKVYLLTGTGTVIGSSDRQGILEKSFSSLRAFRTLGLEQAGYTVERDAADGVEYSIGFSRTAGYNTYQGKGWSVIIRRPTDDATAANHMDEVAAPLKIAA
jgi:hypothetical protein